VNPGTIYFFACQRCEFRGFHYRPEGLPEREQSMQEHREATGHMFVTWEIDGAIESGSDS
jgi:hypothetical protein